MRTQEEVLHDDVVLALREQDTGAWPVVSTLLAKQPLDGRIARTKRRVGAIEECCWHVEYATSMDDQSCKEVRARALKLLLELVINLVSKVCRFGCMPHQSDET